MSIKGSEMDTTITPRYLKAKQMVLSGLTRTEACKKARISRATFIYRWNAEHKSMPASRLPQFNVIVVKTTTDLGKLFKAFS